MYILSIADLTYICWVCFPCIALSRFWYDDERRLVPSLEKLWQWLGHMADKHTPNVFVAAFHLLYCCGTIVYL